MASFIDRVREEIAYARRTGNTERMCAIAECFYSRLYRDDGLPYMRHYGCVEVRVAEGGFTISFDDGKHLHFRKDLERWRVSEEQADSPSNFDPHARAVEDFGAPFAFLEGIAFGLECVRQAENNRAIVSLSSEKSSLIKEIEDLRWSVSWWEGEVAKMEKKARRYDNKLRTPKFIEECLQKAAVVASSKDAPPDAPTATVCWDEAISIFKGMSGIYFLWNGNAIDYVGRSNCIGTRLMAHDKLNREVHRISIVQIDSADSWIVEPYYIWRYSPPLNGEIKKAEGRRKEMSAASS